MWKDVICEEHMTCTVVDCCGRRIFLRFIMVVPRLRAVSAVGASLTVLLRTVQHEGEEETVRRTRSRLDANPAYRYRYVPARCKQTQSIGKARQFLLFFSTKRGVAIMQHMGLVQKGKTAKLQELPIQFP